MVVASSVAIAGVLLVFSFLIIPAIIGTLYSGRTTLKLLIGWIAGALASALGLASSYLWDLPTGGAMVCSFGLMLIIAATMQPLARRDTRKTFMVAAASTALALVLVLLMMSAFWLAAFPRADHPLLDALETWRPGLRAAFLSDTDRDTARQAQAGAERVKQEAKRLTELERNRRWQGTELSDEELRKITSYHQSFQEMQQGEQFVQRELRNKARERQRWVLGAPLFLICLGLLLWTRFRD